MIKSIYPALRSKIKQDTNGKPYIVFLENIRLNFPMSVALKLLSLPLL